MPSAFLGEDAPASAAHDSREVWELLAALQALRAQLWLGYSDEPALGLSVIIAVNATDGYFLIDALREHSLLQEGAPLYFDTQVEGRRLRFECRLAEHLNLEDGPAYRLDQPRLVLDQQRRSAYRVRVPASLRVPAAVDNHGSMRQARLLDLSAQGCSVRIESPLDLSSGEAVRMHLRLNELNLACMAVVRHVQRLPGAARLGMAFDLEQSADASALHHVVAKLQREILRRRSH